MAGCRPGDTVEIDGFLHVDGFPTIEAPISLRRAGAEGGFVVRGASAITVGPDPPELSANAGERILPAPATQSWIETSGPVPANSTHVFVWSHDRLTGLIPHFGATAIQSPGECHRIVEVEPTASGTRKVWLAEGLLDSMQSSPRAVFVDWARKPLRWELDILGLDRVVVDSQGNESKVGRCAVFRGMPGLSLDIRTIMAGDVVVQCPSATIDAEILGQIDEANHYGIVLGPWSSDFRLSGSGHGCRHVQTTSGMPLARADGALAQCGTPWGVVSMRAHGRYNAPLDTHAAGRWIVYERCHVWVTGTRRNAGCVGIKVRARDTLIRDCVIRASDKGVIGSTGVDVWATDCRVSNVAFRDCWRSTNVNPPGRIVAGV